MAKRRKSHGKSRAVERDNQPSLATLLRPPVYLPTRVVEPDYYSPLPEIEDRRTYHPLRSFRPPAVLLGATRSALVPVGKKAENRAAPLRSHVSGAVPRSIAFDAPPHVLICVRRHRRREVLHALRKTGKGARARLRRRNPFSEIRC